MISKLLMASIASAVTFKQDAIQDEDWRSSDMSSDEWYGQFDVDFDRKEPLPTEMPKWECDENAGPCKDYKVKMHREAAQKVKEGLDYVSGMFDTPMAKIAMEIPANATQIVVD